MRKTVSIDCDYISWLLLLISIRRFFNLLSCGDLMSRDLSCIWVSRPLSKWAFHRRHKRLLVSSWRCLDSDAMLALFFWLLLWACHPHKVDWCSVLLILMQQRVVQLHNFEYRGHSLIVQALSFNHAFKLCRWQIELLNDLFEVFKIAIVFPA